MGREGGFGIDLQILLVLKACRVLLLFLRRVGRWAWSCVRHLVCYVSWVVLEGGRN